MQKVAIIDIGSNTMRLVMFKIESSGVFKIINHLKETVRLGEDLDVTREISKSRIDRAVATLKMFKSFCDGVKVDIIIAVATEAIRRATNREEFLEKCRNETGIAIRVLSGEEEAYFDYLGVINSLDVKDGLLMDMGGSSTELVWMEEGKIRESVSLPIGALNLTERFELKDCILPNQMIALTDFLLYTYEQIPWLSKVRHRQLIGIGGSIRNIGKIDRKLKNYPLDITHNYRLAPTDLHYIYYLISQTDLIGRKQIKGLSEERADIFVGPVVALSALVDFSGVNEIVVCGSGIREGLIYDFLRQNGHTIENILDYSLFTNLVNYNLNSRHALHVYHLTKSLYEQLSGLHMLDADMDRVIKTAAILHDCGIVIRYYDHHKHSFYALLNSEIHGLTHRELVLSAYIAAVSSKDEYKINLTKYKALIDKKDVELIKRISILLRIARSLDRSMSGVVQDVCCEVMDDVVKIKVISQEAPQLEINHAIKADDYFRRVYKKDLYFYG